MPNMTIYPRMDDSGDLNDASFDMSFASSSSMDRFNNSVASNNQSFDNPFPFNTSSFDTIEPSSLELFHASHDDSCLDKCLNTFCPPGSHRNVYAPAFPPRSRPNTAFSYPYHTPENSAFQVPQQQMFSQFYPDPFPDMNQKFDFGQDSKTAHQASKSESRIGNYFNVADLGVSSSKRQVPDDCASVNCSKYSCSSDCCSTQVCQEEACSGDGEPCDDLHCFDSGSQALDQLWNIDQVWPGPAAVQQNSAIHPIAHDHPCNHTNTEHDVAITLRDLSAPGAVAPQPQQQYGFAQSGCHLLDNSGQPNGPTRPLSLPDQNLSSLSGTPGVYSEPPSLEDSQQELPIMSKHACRWILSSGGLGALETVCGVVCEDTESLQEHLCNTHISQLSSKTKYVCLWKGCSRRVDQVFASRNKLRRHIATHTAYKPHKCEICGEGFSAQQALDQHIRTHTGETPYECDFEGCGKSFKQKSALTMHKRTHTGEKPLKCEICNKSFGESSNLSKHRKTHNPEYKFKCDEPGCDSQFIRVDQLRRHQTRHDRQKKKQKARSEALSVSPPETPQGSLFTDNDQQSDVLG
ncbi:hypothetical protein GGR54DRAFT_277774 [Hypoxylon sp. NC1633]|nr:hypothetical protein GGR54DRAFT_277774 [Hypoxylon sp. NC1633]